MSSPPVASTDHWLRTWQAAGLGLAAAIGHIAGTAPLSHGAAVLVVAIEVTTIYAIYLGFALADGGASALRIEGLFVAVGLALVGLGLWREPAYLALACGLHGVWDLLHHRDHHVLGVRGVPVWYIPMCAAFDFPVAIAVFVAL